MWKATAVGLARRLRGPGGRRGRALDPLHRARRSRRCRAGAGRRGRARASSAFASSTSTLPRKRSESSRWRCQGQCHSSRPAKCSKSSVRDARGPPSSRRGSRPSSGSSVAGQQRSSRRRSRPRSRPRRCRSVWPIRRASSSTGPRGGPDMITTSTPARWQASSARAWSIEKLALGVAEQRAAAAEQGPVEVGVDAAQGHGRNRSRGCYGAAVRCALAARRSDARARAARRRRDRQRHRRLDVRGRAQRHARAGGRGRAGAGRGRASRCSTSARSPRAAGRRSRPRTRPRALVPAIEGLAARAGRAGLAPTPSRPRSRARRSTAGAVGDQRHRRRRATEMLELVAETRLRLRADAHRGPAAGGPRRRRATTTPSTT